MQDLKQKKIRGGLARLRALGAGFLLRLGSLMILARLLGPKDFGLNGYGHSVHWSPGVVPRFRAIVCRRSAYDYYRTADVNIILGQRVCLERFSDWSH